MIFLVGKYSIKGNCLDIFTLSMSGQSCLIKFSALKIIITIKIKK